MKDIATFSGAGWNITAVADPSEHNPPISGISLTTDLSSPELAGSLVQNLGVEDEDNTWFKERPLPDETQHLLDYLSLDCRDDRL